MILIEINKEDAQKNDKRQHVVVFSPMRGFESARYSNGTKKWKSIIDGSEINPINFYYGQDDNSDDLALTHKDARYWVEAEKSWFLSTSKENFLDLFAKIMDKRLVK
ncbi:MAG: hypothetical protein ACJAXY_002114 [Nonlabens sp.]|jgi:hypothetical protein